MSWYAIDISPACLLGGSYHRLCRAFQRAFIAAGAPPDMALLALKGGPDGARTVYISPVGATLLAPLIEEYEGRPCPCPADQQVTLVYGVPGVEARLLVAAPERTIEPAHERVDQPAMEPVRRGSLPIYPLHPSRQAAAGL